jgi:hypothetical protein
VAVDPSTPTQLEITTAAAVGRTASTLTSTVTYSGTGGATTVDGQVLGAFTAALDTSASPAIYMGTKWDSQIDTADPLADYPRPQLTRPDWESLRHRHGQHQPAARQAATAAEGDLLLAVVGNLADGVDGAGARPAH